MGWEARDVADGGFVGEPSGVALGHVFETRQELFDSGVHRHIMRGIAWSPGGPAESVLLNGGYEDDIDEGGPLSTRDKAGGIETESRSQISL